MLNYIKEQINEKEYMTLTEAVAEKVASGDDSVRDMFLDDPDALVIGSEEDPEVAKMVDSLPDELPETAEVTDSDVEEIKEYFNITEADLEDEFDSEDMYENDDEDIYASDVQKFATEGFEDIEEALNDIESILEGEQAEKYKQKKRNEQKRNEINAMKDAHKTGMSYIRRHESGHGDRKADDIVDKEIKRRNKDDYYYWDSKGVRDRNTALNAAARHERRHGSKTEGIEYLDELFEDYEIDNIIDEAAEMSAEDNYENEGADIYDSCPRKVATEEVEELEDIEEAFDDIEEILEGKITNKVKKVGKDIKKKLPFGKKEGSEEVDDEEEIEESVEEFDFDDFVI